MNTLNGLLSIIKSEKIITVNLYNENDLLLITFHLPGYEHIEEDLLLREVAELKIINLNTINVKLAAATNI